MPIITPESADFTPSRGQYTTLRPFRFWCQKVLPAVYDDSLSYYELLTKVIDYLNKTMEDVETSIEDVDNLRTAYGELQGYVNDSLESYAETYNAFEIRVGENVGHMMDAFEELNNFVNSYFENLDVQEEINNKLDEMAIDGSLSRIVSPIIQEDLATSVPIAVEAWLDENVEPTMPLVDYTLSIAEAASESSTVGANFEADRAMIDVLNKTVDYGYTPQALEADPDASALQNKIGVKRNGTMITLEGTSDDTYVTRVRVSGNLVRVASSGAAEAWDSGVAVESGHKYKVSAKLVDGSAANTGSQYPRLEIYAVGSSTDIGEERTYDTYDYQECEFTGGNDTINLCWYIYPNTTYVDAKYQILLQDVTDPYTTVSDTLDLINTETSDLAELPGMIAPEFNTSNAYYIGDYVMYDGGLYRFIVVHSAGAWDSSEVVAVTIGSEDEAIWNALKADDLTNGYVLIYERKRDIAGSSSWPTRTFDRNIIKINGTFSLNNNNYYTQLDNPGQYSTSASTINGWQKTITLQKDHTYKFSGLLLSGSVSIPSGEALAYKVKNSSNTVILVWGYNESVTFKWTETDACMFYLHAEKGESFTNAVLAYTIVDITDSVELSSDVSELNSSVPVLSTNVDVLMEDKMLKTLKYLSANVFSKYATDYLIGKGYSGSTGSIVNSSNHIITGYIPVKSGDGVQCFVNGINITRDSVDGETRKIAVYDSEKTWQSTSTVNGMDLVYYPITSNGYVRFMLRKTDYVEIYVSSLLKKDKLVDLILFAGQSNMAGRGSTDTTHSEDAPTVIPGAGYEFKSITDPTQLYPITEPFGYAENATDDGSGIYDGTNKTGDIVPSFVNAYYENNGNVPVVGVSASEGGSSSSEWLPTTGNNFTDLATRVNTARTWLVDNGYSIRHQYVLWCQGESDGDDIAAGRETLQNYIDNVNAIIAGFINLGLEKVLLIRIGNCNKTGETTRYTNIIEAQTELAQTDKRVVMVSCDFAGMQADGLMKDDFHYYQEGYNITGNSAGINSAIFATTGKAPTMYDTEYDNLYYSHNN